MWHVRTWLLALALSWRLCPYAALDERVDAMGPVEVFRHALEPFRTLAVGRDDCSSAFDVHLRTCDAADTAECDFELEFHMQADILAFVRHVVDHGVLKLSALPPGFKTARQLMIVVTVPSHSPLEEVEVAGDARMVVGAPVTVVRNAGRGFLKLELSQPVAAVADKLGLRLELTGAGPVLFGAPADAPVHLKALEVHQRGASHIHVQNVVVGELKIFLGGETAVGMGDVYVTGPPSQFATVNHMGTGTVVVAARSADVRLAGTGDVYVHTTSRWHSRVSGRIEATGMGNVFFTHGTCTIRGTAFGNKCIKSEETPPPQKVACEDFGLHLMVHAPRRVEVNVSKLYACTRGDAPVWQHKHGHHGARVGNGKVFRAERDNPTAEIHQFRQRTASDATFKLSDAPYQKRR